MSLVDKTKPSLEEVLTPCTQIAGTRLETLWLVLFGLGLLAGVLYVAFDTAISPFAPYRGADRPLAGEETSLVMPRLSLALPRIAADRS